MSCANSSVSNSSGALIMYTDGLKVYRSNHTIMPNQANSTNYQILSSEPSGREALFVPRPGTSQFYVFATREINTDQIKYAVVDLSINNGQVISVNNSLPGSSTAVNGFASELRAIKHCNGTDYWLIAHEKSSNKFRTYLITNAGIANPNIQSVGSTSGNIYIQMGVTSNGKKVALADTKSGSHAIQLFDFSLSTGTLNYQYELYPLTSSVVSSCAFSPNSRYLYFTTGNVVYRHDLQNQSLPAATVASIPVSQQNGRFWDLLLAPDNNIYVCRSNYNYLSSITNTNTGGVFNETGIPFSAGVISPSELPSFTNYSSSCSFASFVFNNEGQTERSVNSLYGPQIITEVCLPEILIDGSASAYENGYHLEIRRMDNLMTWATTVVYSQWISPGGEVPSTLINIAQYYNGFVAGTDYLVTLSVGSDWSSMSRLLRPKNCPPTPCFVFSGNTQQTTANENSLYGPQLVTSVCLPDVKIDGTCSMNETGYHIQIDPFNLTNWSFIPPNFYNAWPSTTQDAGIINLTALAATTSNTFQVGTVYRVALSVASPWATDAKFFRVKDCRGSVQFEEITPEEIAAAQAGEPAVLIFPNPGSGLFQISNENGTLGQITVCDVMGKTIVDKTDAGTSTVQIDLSAYPAGVYFARIQAGDKIVTRRIIKN